MIHGLKKKSVIAVVEKPRKKFKAFMPDVGPNRVDPQ